MPFQDKQILNKIEILTQPYHDVNDSELTVILVDDHALFRAGLAVLLNKITTQVTVCEVGCAAEALEAVKANPSADMMLLDYELPDMSGIEVLERVKQSAPELPVVMLSARLDMQSIQAALTKHASGFIPKTSTPDVMLSAIRLVLNGGIYIPPEAIAQQAISPAEIGSRQHNFTFDHKPSVQLTQRQMDVLRQMQHGLSNKEIARQLDMSPSTVKVHVAAILKELDVSSRTQAVLIARDTGLLG